MPQHATCTLRPSPRVGFMHFLSQPGFRFLMLDVHSPGRTILIKLMVSCCVAVASVLLMIDIKVNPPGGEEYA